ncbi:chitinase-3 1 isoform X2 [Octopus vulgaris]|uniref:Chitinase-3 1 isoform X2 n=1 Tax=Octopus vulgaris TaxID=6645 RepID=A0AA36B2E4_OCTVU|nr:chitinase-3 1 isoform X2 [Octopus vulgaris]
MISVGVLSFEIIAIVYLSEHETYGASKRLLGNLYSDIQREKSTQLTDGFVDTQRDHKTRDENTDKRKMKLTVISLLLTFGIWKVYGANQIFCYYTSFAQTRRGIGKFVPENINPYLCTHIIFAFVDVSRDGRSLVPVNDNDVQPERGKSCQIILLEKPVYSAFKH